MKPRQFQDMLAKLLNVTLTEIDQRMRPLRTSEIFRSGPRGLGGYDLDPEEAAAMLLALVSRRSTDALQVMAEVVNLRPAHAKEYLGQDSLTGLLAFLLRTSNDPHFPEIVISIADDGSHAWIESASDSGKAIIEWVSKDDAAVARRAKRPFNLKPKSFGRYFVMSSHEIAMIGRSLNFDDQRAKPMAKQKARVQ